METHVDLVTVGGGPTALLTALLVKRFGLTVRVLDAKPEPLQLGRADALNARTQQFLEITGILDKLVAKGIPCNTSSTFAEGEFKSRQSHWWTGLQHVFRKNFLMIGQPEVEKLLAEELGESVSYSEPVESVRETDSGVEVTTVSGDVVHATYCVAADGARSMVRQSLGIPFTGTKPEMTWAVLDTFLDTDFPRCPEIITFELDGESRVAWIPRERDMARFYVLLNGDITEERAKESVKKHLAPYRVDFTHTEWFSTFYVKERLAATFISRNGNGRIFLAGDAAHTHSVNGGQGLNTGLSDSFALAWRLAYALKHDDKFTPGAATRILQSYDTERRKIADEVIRIAARLVRDTKFEANQYVGNVEANAAYITGIGIRYDNLGSPLIRESQAGIFTSGCACPDVFLTPYGHTEPVRLYETVEYGKFLVLVVGRDGGHLGKFKHVARWLRVRPNQTAELQPVNGDADCTYGADFAKDGDSYAVVVRPDMYVSYAGEMSGALKYLEELFV